MGVDIPIGWYIDPMGRFSCMCKNFRTNVYDDINMHTMENGFCEYGLKCISESEYVCICGKTFIGDRAGYNAWNHVEDQIEKKIAKCVNKYMSFCKKCEIQLQSIAAYKIHCNTKSHLEPREDSCKYCNVTYQGKKQKELHLKSAKHKQRCEEGTLSLTCDICQITCKGQKQMKAHLNTNKHKKKQLAIQ